ATAGVVEGPACGTGLAATFGPPSSVGGLPYNCTYFFTEDQTLTQQTGTRFSTGIIGGIYGGNRPTGPRRAPDSDPARRHRITLNLLAHFAVSDAFDPFIEAKWTRVDALGNNAGPSFIQGTFNPFDLRERVRLDNPFLSAGDRTTLTNLILNSGCNTSLTANCLGGRTTSAGISGGPTQGIGGPLNPADPTAHAQRTHPFVGPPTPPRGR